LLRDNKNSKNLRYKVHIKEKTTEKALKITKNYPDFHHRQPGGRTDYRRIWRAGMTISEENIYVR